MQPKDFKALFGSVATAHAFVGVGGGWYMEAPAALFVIDLQKSNLGNYYEVNLKLFLGQSLPPERTVRKRVMKLLSGDIFRRLPHEYRGAFDLDARLSDNERRSMIERAFRDVIDKIAEASVDAVGLLRLRDEGVLYLMPSAEARLKTPSR